MNSPFGSTFKLTLSLAQPWLRLGPGWAALAGVLAAGQLKLNLSSLAQLASLWLLTDLVLGGLWRLTIEQNIPPAQLPSAPVDGFSLPYAQPGSLAARFAGWLRRYRLWRQQNNPSEGGSSLTTLWVSSGAALLIGFLLGPTIFWLTLLAMALILLAGQSQTNLTGPQGGRLQSLVEFLLPWSMGLALGSPLSPLGLALAICGWVTYLGGLRMAGQHRRADWLFWLGQVAAIMLLLGLRLLPGAALLSVLFIAQWLIKLKFNPTTEFFQKAQPYLVAAVIVAGLSCGSL